jgi:predicted nucleic acid-binding protein
VGLRGLARRAGRREGRRDLISFLVDSSAVWRLQRHPELVDTWNSPLVSGAVGSCGPQRAEFRRSARNADEFDQMNQMFGDVYPDVPVPKSIWRWVDSAQYRLARVGAVRALSVIDLLVCGVAAAEGLVVLHDDADYELAERHLPDVRARRVVSAKP